VKSHMIRMMQNKKNEQVEAWVSLEIEHLAKKGPKITKSVRISRCDERVGTDSIA
jgi:hypothetical protein